MRSHIDQVDRQIYSNRSKDKQLKRQKTTQGEEKMRYINKRWCKQINDIFGINKLKVPRREKVRGREGR